MTGAFELHWDTAANRLEYKLSGVFDVDGFAEWEAALRAAVARAPAPAWTMLVDFTEFPLQSEAIQKRAEGVIEFLFANGAVKGVVIASKSVVSMQVKRLSAKSGAGDKFTFVTSRQEALAWLARDSNLAPR